MGRAKMFWATPVSEDGVDAERRPLGSVVPRLCVTVFFSNKGEIHKENSPDKTLTDVTKLGT